MAKHFKTKALLIIAMGPGTPELQIKEFESAEAAKAELRSLYTEYATHGFTDECELNDDGTWALVYSDNYPCEMEVYEL